MKVSIRRFAAIWSRVQCPRIAPVSWQALLALAVLLTPSSVAAQSPYGGTRWAVPGGIQAEDFDNGGQGVGYYDLSSGNNGGVYRATDVDIETTNSGGYAVGWIGAGEWLRYSINVAQAGTYNVTLRVASAGSGGTFHLEFKGVDKSGSLTVQNTGGWKAYQDLKTTVYLEAGNQTLRVMFDSDGSTGAVGNLSFFQFDYAGGGAPPPPPPPPPPPSGSGGGPYGGTPWSLPGDVQAEDFDTGGNGVGYSDNTPGNTGGVYRSTDVDVQTTANGGYAVGWTDAGEWLRYTVNVTAAGQYTAKVRVASSGTGGTFHIEFNGQNKTGSMQVPDTGGWKKYQTITASVSLEAGVQPMRLVFDSNGPTGAIGNVSFIELVAGGSPAPAPLPPPPSGGGTLRVLTWNIKFGYGDTWGQAQAIADSGAHVALLQEASLFDEYMPTTYRDKLQQLTGVAWYSVWSPHGGMYSDQEGTLILSRLPLVAQSTMYSNDRGFSRAVVNVGGVNVTLLNAHLDWYDTGKRTAQLEAFMAWGNNFGGPRIAGGDFNSWWGEWWITKMLTQHTDTWVDVTGSVEGGYTTGSVRFDYIFRAFDQNWRLTPLSCKVRWSKSDHAMVIAEFQVQ
jgi:endonuclease/exonuclease/phosphatase family metal-dependent hydrolase